MNDYISREDVKKLLWERISLATFMRRGIPNAMKSLSLISEELEKIPAADVRPVVLCRDCKHRPYSSEPGKTSGFAVEAPDRECKCPCFNPDDGYYSWIPADDFFCADGDRRKEEP